MSGLKLTKTSDAAHKRVSILIFGEPKVGKTTLAKTLPLSDDSKLLYIAADPGQLALRDRNFVVAQPENEVLDEAFFNSVLNHIKTHGGEYEWIVVDGVDEVADAVLHAKKATQKDSRKAFGDMAEYVEQWMKAIRDTQGVSVVFITHIEQRDAGDGEVEYIPMFPGKKIQGSVDAWFDLIGCMRYVKGEDGQPGRYIQFRREADQRFVVGDRSGVTSLYEDPDLGVVFKKIHEAGFETKGTWTPPTWRPTDEDAKILVDLAKEHGITAKEIAPLSNKMFGKGPRELDQEQWAELTKQIKGVV